MIPGALPIRDSQCPWRKSGESPQRGHSRITQLAECGAVNSEVIGSNPIVRAWKLHSEIKQVKIGILLMQFPQGVIMIYVFKAHNKGDDSDIKISPQAKHLKVIVEADTLEAAEIMAVEELTELLGHSNFKVKYLKNETK